MMWARSVIRSSSALHRRALGITWVHSEKGRLVGRITTARSARSAITWNKNSAPHLGQRDVADLVDRDQVITAPTHQDPAKLQLMLGLNQLVDQASGSGEANPSFLATGGHAEPGQEMGLAGA